MGITIGTRLLYDYTCVNRASIVSVVVKKKVCNMTYLKGFLSKIVVYQEFL